MAKIKAQSCSKADIIEAIKQANPGDTVILPHGSAEGLAEVLLAGVAALKRPFTDECSIKFEREHNNTNLEAAMFPLAIKHIESDKKKKVIVLAWDDYPTPVDHFTVYYGKKSIVGGAPADHVVIVPYNKSCIAIADDEFYEEDRVTYFTMTVSISGGIQSGYSDEVCFVSPFQSTPVAHHSYKGRVGYCLPEHFMSRKVGGMRMLEVECIEDNVCKHCGR